MSPQSPRLASIVLPILFLLAVSRTGYAQTVPSAQISYGIPVHVEGSSGNSIVSDDGGRTWRLVPSASNATSAAPALRESASSGESIHRSRVIPNPTTGLTMIRFTLPSNGRVHLSLTGLHGEEVMSHDHGIREAGLQSLHVDASGLKSGVYSYRVMHDRKPHTRGTLVVAR